MKSHPARGAWIEMQTIRYGQNLLEMSHPARGAWIEISRFGGHGLQTRSHPARGAWIEIPSGLRRSLRGSWSHPARGAWIEMCLCFVAC